MKHIAVAVDTADRPELLLAHGLKLALLHRADLSVFQVERSEAERDAWRRIPAIRDILVRWQVIDDPSDTDAFEALGVHIHPVHATDDHVARGLVAMVESEEPDLLVLGTHGRVGLERLVRGSVAETVARTWHGPTLVLPPDVALVDPLTGAMSIRRVLVPIADDVGTQEVVDAAVRVLDATGIERAEVTALKVGDADTPLVTFPEPDRWGWHGRTVSGKGVVDAIVDTAADLDADLIAMGTRGHDTWADALLGSHTERVIRRGHRAVLTVSMG